MAKKVMKVKKRKYTRRKNVNENILIPKDKFNETLSETYSQFNPNEGDLGRGTAQKDSRASINSFVFVNGCKVLLRNLPDEYLFNLNLDTLDKFASIQREYYSLKELMRNLDNELSFRKL